MTHTLQGREVRLRPGEIIVSKTDPRGRVTYVNDTLVRVSGFTEAEMLGQPHNVVRHPQMPRAVFGYLWTELLAGREVFGYLANATRDGGFYWVFAHVTPTRAPDGSIRGFHSTRRAPQQAGIDVFHPLYRRVLEAEQRAGGSAREQLAAGEAALAAELAARATTFDALVWSSTAAEGAAA
ncbi:PAS domain-containing protein [Nocardioides sp. GY 10127]|uniref:PAS domain-containing protein n=1 Tax=Nocardioides sp. GY 10127 TaxID=2569762 RepID=UPI0010A7F964|nr:PAS domain-containing protein [Nocardioides sp. GY 10127]TIC86406.1 PAS domain-containing protein [Nocardioides sp. GY 10127]